MQFTFQGDLDIPTGSTVNGTGSNGISLYALNDVNVGSNVAFNVNAVGTHPGPGGGAPAAAASARAAAVDPPAMVAPVPTVVPATP